MASLTKLYLRDATTAVSGTLPGTASLDATAPPDVTATGAATNRTLSATAGSSQTSGALTTLAQTAAQDGWLRRFVSEPLAAQTIGAQSITYSGAHSESNNASDFLPTVGLYIWRPSDGTKVATLLAVGTLALTEPGNTQTAGSATATSTAGTAVAGDILVLEVWRNSGTQTNATARTNSVFYDGTTEASNSNVAAFVAFATAVSVPVTYASSMTASLTSSASFGTSYTPAPSATKSLTAILTHTE